MTNRNQIAAYAAVVLSSFAAAYGGQQVSTHKAASNTRSQVEALALRLAVANRASVVRGCERGILDRRTLTKVVVASAHANTVVAHDPRQPALTRAARLAQAEIDSAAAASFAKRIPPNLICEQAYPPVKR